MKVDRGASQVSKSKRLTKLLQGSYRWKAQDGQPVAGSYLESGTMIAKLKFLQKPERYVELGKATIYIYVPRNLETDSNVELMSKTLAQLLA